jgi:hypothetical protein
MALQELLATDLAELQEVAVVAASMDLMEQTEQMA